MNRRRTDGDETWNRLLNWSKGQKPSERFAAHVLRAGGYRSIDPSHPLGGRDGMKDMICVRNSQKWIGASYFPRGQKCFKEITDKFKHDVLGVAANQVDGIAFVTNQELKLKERKKLKDLADQTEVDLLHLERVASIIDSPQCYGIRLEFLDLEMTKEEQLAFIANRDAMIEQLQNTLEDIIVQLKNPELLKTLSAEQIQSSVPLSEIKEFKSILNSIVGFNQYAIGTYSFSMGNAGHINDLRVPLTELREFVNILDRIAGNPVFSTNSIMSFGGHVRDLRVPLSELKEYEITLDRIILKLQEKNRLDL